MDGQVMLKLVVAITTVILIWLYFRPQKRKLHADPVIAAANENERYAWRYVRWGVWAVQFLLGIYVLWTAIRFIFSSQ